ncbi:MAG TPA: NYN domain-containing protein [Gemmatimonadales bacterium]|nr:NYN domain-containing protein [Gemmatimonadales bacterium]
MIDFDNVTMAIRSDLQTELKRLLQSEIIRGKVAVQRAYADWRRYPQYIVPLSESSIDLIFAPAHGANKKNATDIRLAIDALELVFTRPEIGTFILLSGDSDFSSLVLKLKEYGKYVIGVGIRESSSDLLIQNCDEYYSYNELAGFTKASDVEYVKRDPWELVVEAVKQMTAHNDVMRSDRLKQVMQEIDPNFDEKDAGFSRFSKFVIEAARRGLITLTRLDNGQYEIALGPQVEGAPAQPALAAIAESNERARADRSGGGGGSGRRGGRGRGRGSRPEREEPAPPPVPAAEAAEPATPEPSEAPAAKSGFSFGDAFGRLREAVGRIGMDEEEEGAQPEPAESAEAEVPRPVFEAPAAPEQEEEDDIPMPASSAPPPPYSQQTQAPGFSARSRGGRFRRGSRGGRPGQPVPEIPKIGVVEVDPNFRPRVETGPSTTAPKPPMIGGSQASSNGQPERSERHERGGRGGRGRGRGGRERAENGEHGERGRGRRGGRGGRGRGPRRFEAESTEPVNQTASVSAEPPRQPSEPPALQPPAPQAPAEPADTGESFWSKVKRGLTGA